MASGSGLRGLEGSSDDSDEFYDACDGPSPKSRGNSLKRQLATTNVNPVITISQPQSCEVVAKEKNATQQQSSSNAVLPEEIAQELEALSKFDEDRVSRIGRLEKLRRGQEVLPEDEDEDEECGKAAKTSLHDSAESSVEGIYISGSRPSHPFKVIEPEPDRRSVSSDTRSVTRCNKNHSEPVSRGESVPRTLEMASSSDNRSGETPFQWPSHVPDIVSSIQADSPTASSPPMGLPLVGGGCNSEEVIMGPPVRPPRRKKKSASTPTEEVKAAAEPPRPKSPPKPPSPPPVVLLQESERVILRHCPQEPIIRRQDVAVQNLTCSSPFKSPELLSVSHPQLPQRPSSLMTTSTPRLHELHSGLDPLPSPASTVASLTRELETTLHTLDLHAAMRGQFVVKPQDDDRTKGESSLVSEHKSLLEEEHSKIPPKSPRDDSPEMPVSKGSMRLGSGDNRSFKAGSGSGGRRSSSSAAGVVNPAAGLGAHSLGSTYASATSGSSSGGKRSLHSGGSGSVDSGSVAAAPGLTKQMNMFLRTKSDSGKRLSDEEILKQIKVKNLDTGEEMDLVEAEDQLPQSINPLSLHIMRLTSEYVSGDRLTTRTTDSDTESMVSSVSGYALGGKKKKSGVKRFFGTVAKKTTDAAKSIAAEATKKKVKEATVVVAPHEKDVEKLGRLATEIKSSEGVPEPLARDGKGLVFKRIQAHKSGPFDFENIKFAQELSSPHLGPIWCMRFSQCGQLLATAGQDTILRIWVLKNSYNYFKDMRNRYNADVKSSPTNSYENVISDQLTSEDKSYQVFVDAPFCSYSGHTSDLLDVSWSKNYFILTSSMDKTVRLWHISRRECLCCFQHIDFVTAICFHPRNDQFFLSGSLDGKLRLWNIPDKKVALWNEVDGTSKLITTANFIQNGKFAVVGTYDGRCIFYSTDQLKYYTMIHVRSARGKNAQGRKVTGIEPMPGEDKILVTSNDSRIRLYDLRDLALSCKFKGYVNSSSQIRASFSHDGKYITAGSENQCVFLWRTNYEPNNLTVRKDRNSYYEAIKAHNAVVTCSVFAPNPQLVLDQLGQNCGGQAGASADLSCTPVSCSDSSTVSKESKESKLVPTPSFKSKDKNSPGGGGYVVISGDYDGDIKVFFNALRPKHSSLPLAATSK